MARTGFGPLVGMLAVCVVAGLAVWRIAALIAWIAEILR